MAAACALAMFSGRIIYNFAILENLRIFQNCLFTGGVVKENSICSAAFCESAALREKGSPSQALSGLPALPKGEPLAWRESFRQSRKLCRWECSPGGSCRAATEGLLMEKRKKR